MSWVCLHNLLEPDKNLYGLIPGDVKFDKIILSPKPGKKIIKIVDDLINNGAKTLQDLIKDKEFNSPEWRFASDATFVSGVVKVYIMSWIARQKNSKIYSIADATFTFWSDEKYDILPTFHPRFKEDKLWNDGSKSRYVESWNLFMDNINRYRIENSIVIKPLQHSEAFENKI